MLLRETSVVLESPIEEVLCADFLAFGFSFDSFDAGLLIELLCLSESASLQKTRVSFDAKT